MNLVHFFDIARSFPLLAGTLRCCVAQSKRYRFEEIWLGTPHYCEKFSQDYISGINLCFGVDNMLFVRKAAILCATKMYWAGTLLRNIRCKKQSCVFYILCKKQKNERFYDRATRKCIKKGWKPL